MSKIDFRKDERLRELYNYIVKDGKKGHWYSKEEVCNALPQHYKVNNNKENHDKCNRLHMDIDMLNMDTSYVNCIIVRNTDGEFKTAETVEEVMAYQMLLIKALYSRKRKIDIIKIKLERNNQLRLLDANLDNIENHPYAKKYYETLKTLEKE